tara:strand:- start:65 stop:1231 length:1167 start_codon:yes stop_codon:yes gene_type:complete
MNKKGLNTYIDFGSSRIRIGVFDLESSRNIFTSEKDCISNFNEKYFDISRSNEAINSLIKAAEKKIDSHIKNINLMIDTPDMFSIDISIKRTSDKKKYSNSDILSLLQEGKNLIQNNYFDKKIVHMIAKKFIFDDVEYFEIPNKELNYNSLIVDLKFICFSNNIFKKLQDIFNINHIVIHNLYSSSYVRSSNYNLNFENYKKKIFLDIGYNKSTVIVFEDKRFLFFNVLPVGGKHITKDISVLLKIDINDAENMKKSLNKSDTVFENKFDENIKLKSPDLHKQIIHARVDEIIKLNLANEYFNSFFYQNDDSVLIFTGEGSKILNKNSIFLEEKFDFFNEISFFEEDSTSICESGFNFDKEKKFQEVSFQTKKSKNKGFFEKFFNFFN